ncbi:MAG TPA: hypothetical protein VES66_08295 [Terriglobales bacterium]|nr:hypothetical protein [Terriglobales bacterium]
MLADEQEIRMRERIRTVAMALPLAWMFATPGLAHTVELKPETVEPFERYVRQAEQRMEDELRAGKPFLLPDGWPEERRDQTYQQLRRGEMVIERVNKEKGGAEARVPRGLIHHWAGIVFIPGATLDRALTVFQDYDHHQTVYSPEVLRSRLLWRQGDDFHIFLRLRKHKVVTVILDTEYDVHFARLDSHRAYSRSHSTRIAEVENPGRSDERDLPPGNGHGFLWELDTYWRFLEVADGVFIQCEAISLTRDVPTGLGWLIGPFVQSIPRESLEFTLTTTRKVVVARQAAVAGPNL